MDRTSMVDQTFQYYKCHVLILIINKNSRKIFWTVMDRYLKLHETFSKNRWCTTHNSSIDGNTRRAVSWTESCRRGPADAHIPAGSVERGEGGSCSERGWTRVRLQRVQKKEKRLASAGSPGEQRAHDMLYTVWRWLSPWCDNEIQIIETAVTYCTSTIVYSKLLTNITVGCLVSLHPQFTNQLYSATRLEIRDNIHTIKIFSHR